MPQYITCAKCKGEGTQPNHFLGLGTAGFGYIVQGVIGNADTCTVCDGKGVVDLEAKAKDK